MFSPFCVADDARGVARRAEQTEPTGGPLASDNDWPWGPAYRRCFRDLRFAMEFTSFRVTTYGDAKPCAVQKSHHESKLSIRQGHQ